MKPLSFAGALMAAQSLLPCTTAHAVRAADTPPPTPEVVRAQDASPGSTARGQAGQITAAEAGADTVEIDGVAFRVVEGRTQVFRSGRPAALSTLVKGLRIQYKVSPGGSGLKVLGVVHAQ